MIRNPSRSTNYSSPHFSLQTFPQDSACSFLFFSHTPFVTTAALPHTYKFLKAELPEVLRSKCYNEFNLPFSQEVRRTELGHLFEHLLLEYLCQIKLDSGFNSVVHSGRTDWNWTSEERGTFHITIDAAKSDLKFLFPALQKTSLLMTRLINYVTPVKTVRAVPSAASPYAFA